MDFKGKVVLITGGAGGIGKATTRTFLQKGSKVCICDINETEGKRVLKELEKEFEENNIIFSKCDVTKDEEFESTYRRCEIALGTVDILINNAGIIDLDFRKCVEVIQFGTIIGTELAMKKMGKQNGGKGGFVINIASRAGVTIDLLDFPFYSAAKAAVVQYSRIIGSEFHQNYSGVSVMCLCPAAVDTSILCAESPFKNSSLRLLSQHQLKPSEIGEAVIRMINENKSGEVAMITKEKGFFYYSFPVNTLDAERK
ncbi:UNVERIFIED_CONTAM: hypothetical protein RMT77_004144 [Armadillidium vulgare]